MDPNEQTEIDSVRKATTSKGQLSYSPDAVYNVETEAQPMYLHCRKCVERKISEGVPIGKIDVLVYDGSLFIICRDHSENPIHIQDYIGPGGTSDLRCGPC